MNKNITMMRWPFLLLLGITACKREIHGPLEENGNAPGIISNTNVENLPGAANIFYSLPDDGDVLYVAAEFEIRPGVKKEEKSSLYKSFVFLEGFADTLEHKVSLTVVSKSEKRSTPVIVTVKPLLPPYIATFRSLVVNDDWGGLNVAYTNTQKADLTIITLTDTTDNKFEGVDNYYTKLPGGSYSIRGYDSSERRFGFCVKDRWGNVSDTMIQKLHPLYEVALDKSKFSPVPLPGDVAGETNWGDMTLHMMWDGSKDGWDMWHSKSHAVPMWFTFDLGVTAQLSRATLWQRQDDESYMYAQNNVKSFEIWGATSPNPDGSWDASWTKLIAYTIVKPSGSPVGTVTQDDIDAIKAGHEMNIPLIAPRVRYIRVKITETWQTGASAANIAEMSFWGQP